MNFWQKAVIALIFFASQFSLAFDHRPYCDDGEKVDHKHYSLCYVEEHEQSKWTAHRLTSDMLRKGKTKRTNNFRSDPLVSTGSAGANDYRRSGFDRGHMVPAGDMQYSRQSMSESFYMSNISPQNPSFNRGAWRKLEMRVRKWVYKFDELYIVTGPVLNKPIGTIGKKRISVPSHHYKIVLDLGSKKPKVIAFLMPNEGTKSSLKNFTISVDQLEKITGIDFFPQLNDELEDYLESKNRKYLWPYL